MATIFEQQKQEFIAQVTEDLSKSYDLDKEYIQTLQDILVQNLASLQPPVTSQPKRKTKSSSPRPESAWSVYLRQVRESQWSELDEEDRKEWGSVMKYASNLYKALTPEEMEQLKEKAQELTQAKLAQEPVKESGEEKTKKAKSPNKWILFRKRWMSENPEKKGSISDCSAAYKEMKSDETALAEYLCLN